jgi:hypothetical protein
MKLINNWQAAYKYFSVQAMALVLALHASYEALNAMGLADHIPAGLLGPASVVILIVGIVGRMIDQPQAKPDPEE